MAIGHTHWPHCSATLDATEVKVPIRDPALLYTSHCAFHRCRPRRVHKGRQHLVSRTLPSSNWGLLQFTRSTLLTHVPFATHFSGTTLNLTPAPPPFQPRCLLNRWFLRATETCLKGRRDSSAVSFPTLSSCNFPIRTTTITIVSVTTNRDPRDDLADNALL